MTDADLARWEAEARFHGVRPGDVLALIAEVRRLRAELQRRDDQVS